MVIFTTHGNGRLKIFKHADGRHYFMKTSVKRKQNCEDHWSDSTSHFKLSQSHGNDSQTRKLDTVRVEVERC